MDYKSVVFYLARNSLKSTGLLAPVYRPRGLGGKRVKSIRTAAGFGNAILLHGNQPYKPPAACTIMVADGCGLC
jgi:hypothetical protein